MCVCGHKGIEVQEKSPGGNDLAGEVGPKGIEVQSLKGHKSQA